MQQNFRRAERRVIVRGTARITRGHQKLDLRKNESTYILRGVRHRLENIGEGLLEAIEVQAGNSSSENHVIWFKDVYGRI